VRDIDLIHALMPNHDSAELRDALQFMHRELNIPVTETCPIACMGLSMRTYFRLTRAYDFVAPPATVKDVIELSRRGELQQIKGLGPRLVGYVEMELVFLGFPPNEPHNHKSNAGSAALRADCPISCLGLTTHITNPIRRYPPDRSKPPTTVGDLAVLTRNGELSTIKGLGIVRVRQVQDALSKAGVSEVRGTSER